MKRTSNHTKVAISMLFASILIQGCAQQKSEESNNRAPASISDASSQQIVGGVTVPAADSVAASTVQVRVFIDSKYEVYCTGTLISRNVVMTAAHCLEIREFIFSRKLDPKEMAITFGLKVEEASPANSRPVIGGVYHRFYDQTDIEDPDAKNNGDIALLRFSGTLPAGYKPAKVVFDAKRLEKDAKVILAGYGATAMLPNVARASSLMKVEVLLTQPDFSETEVLFAQNNGGGACHGDSGGPAYLMQKSGEAVVFGVTSRSATIAGGSSCLEGSIYTQTAAKRKFILAGVNALFAKSFKPLSPFKVISEAQENSIR